MAVNINKTHTNKIMSDRNVPICGDGCLNVVIRSLPCRIDPNSFMQRNHQQTEAAYMRLPKKSNIRKTETGPDPCRGLGTIPLPAAQRVRNPIGAGVVEEAAQNTRFNAHQTESAGFHAGDASEWIRRPVNGGTRPDVPIVDLPRMGLATERTETAAAAGSRAVGYVSREPATPARDLKEFEAHGCKLRSAQGPDLFLQITRCETAGALERASA